MGLTLGVFFLSIDAAPHVLEEAVLDMQDRVFGIALFMHFQASEEFEGWNHTCTVISDEGV